MLHGPCGVLNRKCACMVNGECRFRYPRQFCAATQQGKDSYPLYRRRDDGRRVNVRGAELDNRWVVPYNPGLLMTYNCHINVEACSSIKACKYLFKYVHKGHDCGSYSVDPARVINETHQYRNARYISPWKQYIGFLASTFLEFVHLFCSSSVIYPICSLLLLRRQPISMMF